MEYNHKPNRVSDTTKNRPIRLEDLRVTDHQENTIKPSRNTIRIDIQDYESAISYKSENVDFAFRISNKVVGDLANKCLEALCQSNQNTKTSLKRY